MLLISFHEAGEMKKKRNEVESGEGKRRRRTEERKKFVDKNTFWLCFFLLSSKKRLEPEPRRGEINARLTEKKKKAKKNALMLCSCCVVFRLTLCEAFFFLHSIPSLHLHEKGLWGSESKFHLRPARGECLGQS